MKKVLKHHVKKKVVPFFDRVLGKTMSKKLTVFFIGTIFLVLGKLSGDQWINLAMIYIGTQASIDALIALRQARKVKQEDIIDDNEPIEE